MEIKPMNPAETVDQKENTPKDKPVNQGLAGLGSSLASSNYDLDVTIHHGKLPAHQRGTSTCNNTCVGCVSTDSGCHGTQTCNSTCSGC